MTEIFIVRHGETAWNVAEVFRGRLDVELNETGRRQTELLAEYLVGQGIAAVYASPLARARQTAAPLAQRCGLDLKIEPGLIDLDFGRWQGLSHQEVKEKFRELYRVWQYHPEQVRMPEGESLEEVRERALALVNDMLPQQDGGIVLVSHRVVNKVLICALLGLDNSHFWNIRQDTCGITCFDCNQGRYVLNRHNDTSHLPSRQTPRRSDF
ncbi:histidine phosphatase family protein [Chloroflexota bacterium]